MTNKLLIFINMGKFKDQEGNDVTEDPNSCHYWGKFDVDTEGGTYLGCFHVKKSKYDLMLNKNDK